MTALRPNPRPRPPALSRFLLAIPLACILPKVASPLGAAPVSPELDAGSPCPVRLSSRRSLSRNGARGSGSGPLSRVPPGCGVGEGTQGVPGEGVSRIRIGFYWVRRARKRRGMRRLAMGSTMRPRDSRAAVPRTAASPGSPKTTGVMVSYPSTAREATPTRLRITAPDAVSNSRSAQRGAISRFASTSAGIKLIVASVSTSISSLAELPGSVGCATVTATENVPIGGPFLPLSLSHKPSGRQVSLGNGSLAGSPPRGVDLRKMNP